jgi:4-hydroxy-tetrahydrodipicolinate synthase
MEKKLIFEGVATALITPFTDGGDIDFACLGRLIDMQIEAGIDCLVIGGTTGEAACLTDSEREMLYSYSHDRVGGRCKLILGCGSCDTRRATEYATLAARVGADGTLCVTPYYNKGTACGVISHFLTVAEGSGIPLMLYNVPSRTGVDLPISAITELAEHRGICGIKEASGSHERLVALAAMGDSLPLYAGNDSEMLTTLMLGGKGVISVVSNVLPRTVSRLVKSAAAGDIETARRLQLKLLPLIRALFCETNPAPIKALMSAIGLCGGTIRLPLTLPSEGIRDRLVEIYSEVESAQGAR